MGDGAGSTSLPGREGTHVVLRNKEARLAGEQGQGGGGWGEVGRPEQGKGLTGRALQVTVRILSVIKAQ